jgi:hypothetical protein
LAFDVTMQPRHRRTPPSGLPAWGGGQALRTAGQQLPGTAAAPRAPLLPLQVAGLVLLAGAVALPLGMDRPAGASLVAAGYGLSASGDGDRPLATLAIRALACLPFGDVATRANLASLLAAALAAYFLARLLMEILSAYREPVAAPTALAGPAPRAAGRPLEKHELTAAAAGAAVPLFCLGVFLSLTSAATTGSTLALLAAGWLSAFRSWQHPGRTRDGLLLALTTGLGLGADAVVPLLLGPLALILWWRSLRRGERWPLLAPMVGVLGAALCLYSASLLGGAGPLGFAESVRRVLGSTALVGQQALRDGAGMTWQGALGELVAQLGVVAGLVALDGLVVLTLRAPRCALAVLVSALAALGISAGPGGDGSASAWAALLAVAGVPLAVGIVHLSSKLGAARVPAAAVVAVVAMVTPALDGGDRRWRRSSALSERLLVQAQAGLPPRAAVDPGSAAMAALFGYAQAIGRRPDLSFVRPAAAAAPASAPKLAASGPRFRAGGPSVTIRP